MSLERKNKSLLLGLILIGLAVIISIVATKTRSKPEPKEPSAATLATVLVSEVRPSSNTPLVTTTARVSAKYDIDIVSQVSGIIESIEPSFARGMKVSAGETLLKIDDLNYLALVSQARSNVAQAEQNLATEKGLARQAKREWRDLGSTEANELFLRSPQMKSAETNLEAAETSLLQAQQDLDRTAVTSPFDGQITTIHANLGQFVTSGTPIARVVSVNYLEIAVPLTPNELSRLGFNSKDAKQIDIQREVELIVSNGFSQGENQTIKTTGTLLRIDHVLNQESQVAYAMVEVEDENTPLKTGQLIDINIPGNPQPNSFWLPEQALYERSQVLVVVDDFLRKINIQVLDLRNNKILVSGLNQGDQVVIDRPLWSTPGSEVEIENTKTEQENNDSDAPLVSSSIESQLEAKE